MSEAPERIIAMATREGAFWKRVAPDPWFGEAFKNVEYIRADLVEPNSLLQRIEQLQAENTALKAGIEHHELMKDNGVYLKGEG